MVAKAVTIACRDTGSAADAAFIEEGTAGVGRIRVVAGRRIGAIVDIIADAVEVHVGSASATAHTEDVFDIAAAIAVTGRNTTSTTDTTFIQVGTGLIGWIVVVAGRQVRAVVRIVADAVQVGVDTASSANPADVQLVAEAIAVAGRDAGSATHATLVERGASPIGRVIVVAGADIAAVVVGIADAVTVGVDSGSATVTTGVELVAEAIAIAGWNAAAAADAALVECGTGRIGCVIVVAGADIRAVVGVVTDAVPVDVGGAGATAVAEGVELVAAAIAVAGRDACASADTTLIEGGARTVGCLLYTSPSPRDRTRSRMPSSA